MNHRALILHVYVKQARSVGMRTPEACVEEAINLAHAIDLDVIQAFIVPLAKVTPATLMGKGKAEEIADYVKETEAELVVVNGTLTPIQQRNLEKMLACKVIDRTALILEIFGARARTHEGKLQVELAALEYQKSRLVRSWTHLERQRGGFGFMGGPGESQIEIDRRLINDRITKIKKQLEKVVRTRELHRKVRRDTPYPVVALVGYTNAGKSTLFNRLTGADVMAMDKLFATLDPTMRAIKLPSGTKIILSDTVGFVSDLPTELVAAFRATLEEVLGADLILHIHDISHADKDAQTRDVEQVISGLFGTETQPENLLNVYNKIDQMEDREMRGDGLYISAITGEGIDRLVEKIDEEILARFYKTATYNIPMGDGKSLAWLHAHGKVVAQETQEEYIRVTVELSPENLQRFGRHHAPV